MHVNTKTLESEQFFVILNYISSLSLFQGDTKLSGQGYCLDSNNLQKKKRTLAWQMTTESLNFTQFFILYTNLKEILKKMWTTVILFSSNKNAVKGFKIPPLPLANHGRLGSRKNDSTVLLPNLEFCSRNLLNEVCLMDDILLPIFWVLQTAGCLEILVSATRAEILKRHVNWIHPVFNLGQFFYSMCRHILS